jgi:hypothetical protein
MAKCPKCGKEIECLINVQSGYNYYRFELDDEGVASYESEDDFQTTDVVNDYCCDECNQVLFTDEEEAIEFLKGKEE